MTLSLTLSARAAMFDGLETFMATGAGPAQFHVNQGNTGLVVFPLSNTPFGSASSDGIVLASTPITNTSVSVAGTANNFYIHNRNQANAFTGTISAIGGGGDIEVPSLSVTAGLLTQRLNALVLRMSSSGIIFLEASLTLV